MKASHRKWSREEAIVVLALYCRIPFAKSRQTNPEVVRVARIIGREPSAVHLRIGNFGSFDPRLREKGITGLPHTGALAKNVWDEFQANWSKLAVEADRIEREMAARQAQAAPQIVRQLLGRSATRMSQVRVNQDFFRRAILASYGAKCCVTGINAEKLLVASHIKPWAQCDAAEKLNPQNGLCLNALHDRAFDRGLITVGGDSRIRVSRELSASKNPTLQKWLASFAGRRIASPEKFAPAPDFLAWHEKNVFLR